MHTYSDILGVGDVLCVGTSAAHPDWWKRLAETARRQAALPHREGGFALTSAVAIADACYVGGVTRVCQIIASDEHSAFPTYIASLPITLHTSALEPLCHLRDAWDSVALAIRVPNVPPSTTMEATCGERSVRHLVDADTHTQRLLTHTIAASLRLKLMSDADDETRARLVSCNGYGATAHLRAIPVRWDLRLTNLEAQTEFRFFLGLPQPSLVTGPRVCNCAHGPHPIDVLGQSTVRQCAFAKRIVPHNLVQSAMHRIACECEVESRRCTELDLRPELGGVSKKQPDLAFSNFKSGAT
eukprot:SAG11_NODE_5123_length_1657_cov_6.820282_1_plen_298_part_10